VSAPDPIARLGLRLFQAAREEPIPEGAVTRALEAARAGRGAPVARLGRAARVSLFGAAATLAAGIALFADRHEGSERISAEPSSTLIHDPQQAAPSAIVREPKPVATTVASETPVLTHGPSAPAPVHSAPVSLGDELDALKVASSALAAGDTRGALAALDRYDHVLKGKKMRAEATLLRIEALSRSGQAGAASALAQQFADKNPESPLVDRARSFVK
jgi:hypothetical protein